MKIKTKLLVILSALSLLFVLNYCDKKVIQNQFKEELKSNEKEKIIIDQKKKTVTKVTRKNNRQVEKKVIEGVRKSEVVISDNNQLSVTTRNRGVLCEPGLSLFYSKNRMNLGLDIQFLYWRRYGASMGFGASRGLVCSAYCGLTYNFFSNTYLFIGVNDEIKPILGLKVSF